MAGKKGRGKKAEAIAVEAADSTSVEEQSQQNGSNDVIEIIKPSAPAKKGGRIRKEVAEKVEKNIEDKPERVTTAKKVGRGKKEELNGNIGEINGQDEPEKEEHETIKKKGRSKKEVNGSGSNTTEDKLPDNQTNMKRGRSRKVAAAETPLIKDDILEDIEQKGKKLSPNKKTGRKRPAEAPIQNDVIDEPEIIDIKKQKKEKETKLKVTSTENENSKTSSSKTGKNKKKKESLEAETEKTSLIQETDKSVKNGRGRKRANIEEISNDAIEDINAEEKKVEPVMKKGKKTKATAKTDFEKTTKNKPVAEKKSKMNSTETFYDTKNFELDQDYSLKISSWNVAGLRSWITKGGLKYIEYEKPDIFCLQEIKCSEDMIPEEARIQSYHPYWYCKPGGYAGVAIYSKKMPINVEYGIGDDEQDVDGRIMTAEYEKFYLINVYVPNAGRKLITLPKRMRWDNLFHDYITKLNKKKPVIICGDMNVAHQETDLANPKTNKKNAGFTQEERDGLTKLLSLGFVDSFRYLYPDKTKAYTFWTYMMNARAKNVGWRLDYFILSEKLISKVVENAIRSEVMGSDHCPITLFLKN